MVIERCRLREENHEKFIREDRWRHQAPAKSKGQRVWFLIKRQLTRVTHSECPDARDKKIMTRFGGFGGKRAIIFDSVIKLITTTKAATGEKLFLFVEGLNSPSGAQMPSETPCVLATLLRRTRDSDRERRKKNVISQWTQNCTNSRTGTGERELRTHMLFS
jgi:hypothetical protein